MPKTHILSRHSRQAPARTASASARPEARRTPVALAGPAPAPAEQLRRAERLGHRIDARHLPASGNTPIQRYFVRTDLAKAKGVPFSARISENLHLLAVGPQTVYAGEGKIREANNILGKGSKIVLQAGERQDIDMALPADPQGLQTISFDDYYEVIPRYNPEVVSEYEDLPRSASPEKGESREETAEKHKTYISSLKTLLTDYDELQKEVLRGAQSKQYATEHGGLASLDPTEWYGATNGWARTNGLRLDVLKQGLNDLAGSYMTHQSVKQRDHDLDQLGRSLARFVQGEMAMTDSIALPTDCGQVVTYVTTGGRTVKDDTLTANPDIGSNYYAALPQNAANLGWVYHWAGVILKDGGDNVTLESAGGTSLGNLGKASWWMQMYGTRNVNQTFKKQINLLHVTRNREMLHGQEETPKIKKAKEQLLEQRENVLNWTALDSDQG